MKIKIKKPVGFVVPNTTAICVTVRKNGRPLELEYGKEVDVELKEYNLIVKEFGEDCIELVEEVKKSTKGS